MLARTCAARLGRLREISHRSILRELVHGHIRTACTGGATLAPTAYVAHAFIGTSGWVYAGWREHLYADTPVKKWLQVASRTFDALEINGSFYM